MKTLTSQCTRVAALVGATLRLACQLRPQARFWAWLSLITLVSLHPSPAQAAVAVGGTIVYEDQCVRITCPPDQTVFTCTDGRPVEAYPAMVEQLCAGALIPVTVTCTPTPPTVFPLGTTTVNCKFTVNGKSFSCSFKVTVIKDVTPPKIECPPNIEVVACPDPTGLCGAVIPKPAIVATDDSGIVSVSCDWPTSNFFPCGTTTVTCTAFDRCQNKTTCSFTVTVKPGKAPTIKCPPNELIVFSCVGPNGQATLNYPAPIVDPPGTTVICTPPPGTLVPFNVGILVTCTASNACGVAQCKFVAIVRPIPPPIITCPPPTVPLTMVIPCNSNCVPVKYPLPTVTNGALESCKPAIGDCLGEGTHVITCTATNECGRSTCEFVINIVRATAEPPIINCPKDITIITCDPCVKVAIPSPTVLNGALAGCSLTSGVALPDCFKPGVYVIQCVATNACGKSICTFTLTVREQPPVHIACPQDIVVETCDLCAPVLYPTPIVINGLLESCNPPSGTCFKVGTNVVTCVGTNSCSKDVCRFNVIVKRKPLPLIRCPQDIVVTSCEPCVKVTYPTPVIIDGALMSCTPPSGFCFPKGVTVVTCLATNDCGRSECKFTVTVRDGGVDPISITCPQNILVETCDPCAKVLYPAPVVLNGVLAQCIPPSGFCFPPGVNIVRCLATNACGQRAECKFTVIVRRKGPPVIHCPDNIVLETCDNCAPLAFPAPVVLNGALVSCNPPLGTCLPIGVHPVVCIASNECGRAECKFLVTVRKHHPIDIKCPEDIIIRTCAEGEIVKYPKPIIIGSDDPSSYVITCTPPPGSFFPVGTNKVICCVFDRCTQQKVCCTFNIIVTHGGLCVKPPANMVLWLPLDEPAGVIANNIVAGAPNGVHIGAPVPLLGQKVLNSLGFNGAGDYVAVPNYAAISLNTTDLSIDAWVLRREQEGRRVIVSKVGQVAAGNTPRGYEFFLNNGLMHLWLGGTSISNYNSGVVVPNDNKWHHVAVTVAHSGPARVRFYLDGATVSSILGPIVGPLGNSSRLHVGAATYPGLQDFWRGYLDEIEVFDRELSPSEVLGLYKADSAGKCKIKCVLPWDLHYPADGSPILAQVFFCNYSGAPQTITYVPEGPMPISGPGSITLQPGECSNVWIRIDRPTIDVPVGTVIVWNLTVYPSMGCPFVCKGSVINPGPVQVTGPDGITGVPGTQNGNLRIGLNGLPPGTPLRIRAIGPDMEPDLTAVSLNGLPPGQPVIIGGGVSLAADDMTLDLLLRFVKGNAVDTYTILLEADLDGDGQYETLRSFDVSNPVVTPPTLTIENTADGSVIKWNDEGNGILEVAESLDGPWKAIAGARPGYLSKNTGKLLFFRVTVPLAE